MVEISVLNILVGIFLLQFVIHFSNLCHAEQLHYLVQVPFGDSMYGSREGDGGWGPK